jgi:hypothetical protein
MKRKLSIMLASALGALFMLGTSAAPASAMPRSCLSAYSAYMQAQQTYDSWNNMVWSFENSAEWYYQVHPDGSSQLMVHVDYQDLAGEWSQADYTDFNYVDLVDYIENNLNRVGNLLSAAESAYATCGY